MASSGVRSRSSCRASRHSNWAGEGVRAGPTQAGPSPAPTQDFDPRKQELPMPHCWHGLPPCPAQGRVGVCWREDRYLWGSFLLPSLEKHRKDLLRGLTAPAGTS